MSFTPFYTYEAEHTFFFSIHQSSTSEPNFFYRLPQITENENFCISWYDRSRLRTEWQQQSGHDLNLLYFSTILIFCVTYALNYMSNTWPRCNTIRNYLSLIQIMSCFIKGNMIMQTVKASVTNLKEISKFIKSHQCQNSQNVIWISKQIMARSSAPRKPSGYVR